MLHMDYIHIPPQIDPIYISNSLKLNSDSLIKFDLINGKPSEMINIGNIFEETIMYKSDK